MATESNYIERHVNEVGNSQKSKEQYLSEGIAYDKAKQYQLALEACEQAIQLDLCYGESIVAYEQAILFNPDDANAYLQLGKAMYELGLYKESGNAYKRAVQYDSTLADIYTNQLRALTDKGETLYDKGRYRE